MIIADNDQKEIIHSYEKDYGSLLMAYNKLGSMKNADAMNILRMKAETLRGEIVKDISPSKNRFFDSNLELAISIARGIDDFININLDNSKRDITVPSNNSTTNIIEFSKKVSSRN